jgi:hypothetical protein
MLQFKFIRRTPKSTAHHEARLKARRASEPRAGRGASKSSRDGRPAGRFYYLRDGVGILTVFHQERATIDATDTFGSIFADNWGLWLVDLDAWKASPIADWGFGSSSPRPTAA